VTVTGLAAAGWAAIAASSLVVGCALTLWLRPADRVVGLTMGFGAGALISASSYELVLEAVRSAGPVVFGMSTGALVFWGADAIVDRRGGANRKRIAAAPASDGSGEAIFIGTLLDGIPESLVLGISLAVGGRVSLAFLVAVFVSNLPEAIAATGSLDAAGWPRRRLFDLWLWVVAAAAVSGAAGYALVRAVPEADGAFAQAFGAGAVLTMLADAMIPEAFEHGGKVVGLVTVAGFIIATALSGV
jgi:zinc transporter, ZIP family